MAKKVKKPAKRARKKASKAKVRDVAVSAAGDDVQGHMLGMGIVRRVGER
jgi:hypothetical protein